MDAVKTMLEQMEVGEGIEIGPLTLFPLLSENDGDEKDETDYLLLDEAIESKQIEITEVDKSGSVPELRVVNSGAGLSGSLRSWYYRLIGRRGAVIAVADRPPSSAEPGGRRACHVNATCAG